MSNNGNVNWSEGYRAAIKGEASPPAHTFYEHFFAKAKELTEMAQEDEAAKEGFRQGLKDRKS